MITTGGGGVFFIYMVLHTVPEGISEIIMWQTEAISPGSHAADSVLDLYLPDSYS